MLRLKSICWGVFLVMPGSAMAQESLLFVGLLNGWGVATPNALYRNGSWERITDVESYKTLRRTVDFQYRNQWNGHFGFGWGTNRLVSGGPVVRFDDEYPVAWGVLTDFPVLEIVGNRRPPTVGLLVSAPHRLGGAMQVREPQGVFRDMVAALGDSVVDWNQGAGFSITSAYWMDGPGVNEDWVFFSAERWTQGRDACRSVEVVLGWVHTVDSLPTVHTSRQGGDCEGKGLSLQTPRGRISLEGRHYVFMEQHGWASGDIQVIELTAQGPRKMLP